MSRLIDADALTDKYGDWYTEEGSEEGYIGTIKGIVDSMPTIAPERKWKWIPVTERLPEDGTWNLFTDGKNISIERYKMDAIDHFFPQGRWFSLDKAIAWMPLPSPYREEGEQ